MKNTRPVFPTPAPTFTSERLLYRPIQDSDFNGFSALRNDLEVMKWTGQGKCDVDIAATRAWMARYMPPNDSKTFTFCLVERSNPESVVGSVGYHTPDKPDCGYVLARKHWGKGYATEAFKAFLKVYWALDRTTVETGNDSEDEWEPERVTGTTDVDNEASRKVLLKCGFSYVGESEDEKGRRCANYSLQKPA